MRARVAALIESELLRSTSQAYGNASLCDTAGVAVKVDPCIAIPPLRSGMSLMWSAGLFMT